MLVRAAAVFAFSKGSDISLRQRELPETKTSSKSASVKD